MKRTTSLMIFIFLSVLLQLAATAQDTIVKRSVFESVLKKSDSVKLLTDSLRKVAKTNVNTEEQTSSLADKNKLTIVIGFFIIMLLLLIMFFANLHSNKQRIGYQSIKLIGLILIFPGICILALIGGEKILGGTTLAVLLGTIAGYVLSRDDDTSSKSNPLRDGNRTEGEDPKERVKKLEDLIKAIKTKNPETFKS